MSPVDVVERADSQPAARTALPDPGEQVPRLAWPTVALFLAGAAAFVGSTVGYVSGAVPMWVPIVVNAVVTFTMFTVVHDAVHYAISSTRWVPSTRRTDCRTGAMPGASRSKVRQSRTASSPR